MNVGNAPGRQKVVIQEEPCYRIARNEPEAKKRLCFHRTSLTALSQRSSGVALIISDGWDRGDIPLLEREIARLARSSTRLIWLNPLLGYKNYEPLTRGIQSVLPHITDFLPVHNLESLTQIGLLLASLRKGGPQVSAWQRK